MAGGVAVNRVLALALLLLAGGTDPSLGINIGGSQGHLSVSPTMSGTIGTVSVSGGG